MGCRISVKQKLSQAPTVYSGNFIPPQNRYALCGFYVVLWDRKSGAEFFYSDTALILLLVCFSSIAFLHRFCRLAPIEALPQAPTGLCPFLVSEVEQEMGKVEQEIYSQGASPLDPDQGRASGPFARFARCFFYFIFIIFSFSFDPCCVDISQVFQILFL